MKTLKAKSNNRGNQLIWLFSYIIILVGLLFSFVGLTEFYNVGIKSETSAYPWGPVNDVPWYYQTPKTYSIYNLTNGLLFLALTLLTFWATLRKNKKGFGFATCLMVLLVLGALISATAQ